MSREVLDSKIVPIQGSLVERVTWFRGHNHSEAFLGRNTYGIQGEEHVESKKFVITSRIIDIRESSKP